ncbi:MAG TPA: hypothetical protein DFS52_24725, partial [Myxococcales bacterium]|nr:hypothetical protein [Myxococcales bacterium]
MRARVDGCARCVHLVPSRPKQGREDNTRSGRKPDSGRCLRGPAGALMKALLFDLDGTLVDSRVDIAASANFARRTVGLAPRPQEEIFGFIGEGAERLIERTLGAEHSARVPEALASWREHYERHMLDHTRPYEGVVEALEKIEGPRAIVTNKPGPSARQLVRALGLDRLCP